MHDTSQAGSRGVFILKILLICDVLHLDFVKYVAVSMIVNHFKESFLVVALYNAALVIEGRHILQTSLKRLLTRYGCKILVGDSTQKCLLFMQFSNSYRLDIKVSYAEKLAIAISSDYDIEALMTRAKTGAALNDGEKKAIEAHQIVADYCYEGRVSPEFFLN